MVEVRKDALPTFQRTGRSLRVPSTEGSSEVKMAQHSPNGPCSLAVCCYSTSSSRAMGTRKDFVGRRSAACCVYLQRHRHRGAPADLRRRPVHFLPETETLGRLEQ